MKYIVVVVMICLQQTAILKWSLAAKFKAIPFGYRY
jgi:hypothetical protein